MGKAVGWFSLLMAATISGLIIKVVGDPLVEVTNPQMKDTIEDTQDFLGSRQLRRQVQRQWRRWFDGDSLRERLRQR
jgi:hypothetical protein